MLNGIDLSADCMPNNARWNSSEHYTRPN